MEILVSIGTIAGAVASIAGAVKYIPKLYNWVCSWKIVKRREFERLKTIEIEHQKCDAEKEKMRSLLKPMAREWSDPHHLDSHLG